MSDEDETEAIVAELEKAGNADLRDGDEQEEGGAE